MRLSRSFCSFLILLASSAYGVDWKDVKEKASSGIVRVYVVHETREHLKPYRQGDLARRMGTGFFIDESTLVTNQHIIEGARSIKVEGVRSKEKFAMRLASKPSIRFDLATLEFTNEADRERFQRINGPIGPLEWAGWDEARPGGQIAVLGFGNSEKLVATQGIISSWEARHDLYQRRLDHVTLIRTDAAVNPGNSGGPAISPEGRVIGISARYGAGENIGLLIPFSTARQVVSAMMEQGRFVTTDTGILAYNLNPVSRKALGVSAEQAGLVVSHVLEHSPAADAGIKRWDIVTAVNGQAIDHGEINHPVIGKVPWWFAVNTATPGTELKLEIKRNGADATVHLAMKPVEVPRIWLPTEGADYPLEWGYLGGLVITEVTRELLEKIESTGNWRWDLVNDAGPGEKLFLVTSIEPDTQAMSYSEYGLDLLQLRVLAIDGRPVEDSLGEHLDRLYASLEQGSAPPFIAIELEKNISIQFATDQLIADMAGLEDRFPGIVQQAVQPRSEAAAMQPHQIQRGTTHRWLRHAQDASARTMERPCSFYGRSWPGRCLMSAKGGSLDASKQVREQRSNP
ncbi:MAG: trypsin-like peptidase domain-containing protein [Sedimenticolaceae bacterium]